MTKDEYMMRCETIWAKGHARPELFLLMRDWLDAVMRHEHTMFSVGGQTQGRDWFSFLQRELGRTNMGRNTLANDVDGYALQDIAAILSHPCQQCAASKDAWHTRSGFCDHREAGPDTGRKP